MESLPQITPDDFSKVPITLYIHGSEIQKEFNMMKYKIMQISNLIN